MTLDQRYQSPILLNTPQKPQTTPPKPQNDHFAVDFASKLCYNHLRWFLKHGEMAERLMALVLKVQRMRKKLDISKGLPMFDIGVLLFLGLFDVRKACHPIFEKSDGRLYDESEIGWQTESNRRGLCEFQIKCSIVLGRKPTRKIRFTMN